MSPEGAYAPKANAGAPTALAASPNLLAAPAPAVSTVRAFITGYNTVPGQTDDTPCLAAGGNICGRTDVVACPRDIPLRTWVRIDGKKYECMDRTAPKHDGRFDISCDKDVECAYRQTRWAYVEILSTP